MIKYIFFGQVHFEQRWRNVNDKKILNPWLATKIVSHPGVFKKNPIRSCKNSNW